MQTESSPLEFERDFWGLCANTFHEEQKQLVYAQHMGLRPLGHQVAHPPTFDMHGARVLDIGGGPASLLLKCVNLGFGTMVADPCDFPSWVEQRYLHCGIGYLKQKGEDLSSLGLTDTHDEVWIYNVLQHTEDPLAVLRCAMKAAPVLRVFEWLGIEPYEGHPHRIDVALFEEAFEVQIPQEDIVYVNQDGAVGLALTGCFAGWKEWTP